MAKLKVKINNGQVRITEKLPGRKTCDDVEIALIASKLPRGFFRPSVAGLQKIYYSGPASLSLRRFLHRGIDQNTLFIVVAQIAKIFKKIERCGLQLGHLVLDKKLIFVHQKSKELYFIYRPVSHEKPISAPDFIEDILTTAVFKQKDDINAAAALLAFVKGAKHFSADQLGRYIEQACPEACSEFSDGQSAGLTAAPSKAGLIGARIATGQEETCLLSEEKEGSTTLLEAGAAAFVPSALMRKRTNEQIMVDKPVFRIGKEKGYVDYCVCDNRAVSRSHADIITREKRFFILDRDSTNKTYVNDVAVPAQQEIEIFVGDRLRLADEEFVLLEFKGHQRGRT